MSHTDMMVARLQTEVEDKRRFQDGLIEGAQREGRDLKPEELALYERASSEMQRLEAQLGPLREGARIAVDSERRSQELAEAFALARGSTTQPQAIEYRSAGAYIADRWAAGAGVEDAKMRLDLYHRAAAHVTTGDMLGVVPEPVIGPVVNFIDSVRPIVATLGPRPIPGGPKFFRPRVNTHTAVGPQTAEKTELVSQKMSVGRLEAVVGTYGGYVNVSRQLIDWSSPDALDIIVGDLAAQYAIETEEVAATALVAAATAGPTLPADPTGTDVAGALWTAAGSAYVATKGAGRLIVAVSPDMLGVVGPLFAPVNPQNAQSSGFSAGSFGQGAMGAISGISVVMSAALPSGTLLVFSTAAAEVYEQRIGQLSVVEPSVLGTQVAYAGYFAPLVIEPTGIIEVTSTP